MNGIKEKEKLNCFCRKKNRFLRAIVCKLRAFSKNRNLSTTPIWLKFGRKGDFSV